MKIFFDTEFEGLYKNANLISIGLITEKGNQLYIENKEINPKLQDDWIKNNVLSNTILFGDLKPLDIVNNISEYFSGSLNEITNKLTDFLNQYDYVELVSDVCHYDMVQFIDIFGDVFSLPKNICLDCYNINQDIARIKNINLQQAFDYNREDIIKELNVKIEGNKHNALYDAKVIKTIYENYKF